MNTVRAIGSFSRVVVTGGEGFIGSQLVRRLAESDYDVVSIDSLERELNDGGVEYPRTNGVCYVRRPVSAALEQVGRGDTIVHLAAVVGVGQSMYEPTRYVSSNTLDTVQLLEHAVSERVRKIVVASSMSVYGEGEYYCPDHGHIEFAPHQRSRRDLAERRWEPPCPMCGDSLRPRATRESKALLPSSIYAITKRDQEEMCLVIGHEYEIPTVALRFFNVYGPDQAPSNPYTGVVAGFAQKLAHGLAPVVFEDGLQTRDFIHVSDVVDALMLAVEGDACGAFNVGTGAPTSVLDVATALTRELDVHVLPSVEGRYRAGDVRHCYADTSRAKRILGFQSSVDFSEGLKDLVTWADWSQQPEPATDATSDLAARGLLL